MIPFKEVNVLDINSEYLGVPTSRLMENAGKGTADAAMERFAIKEKKVIILCGPGNNGGDGFVAARHLEEHCKIKVVLVKPQDKIRSLISNANFLKIKDRVDIIPLSELETAVTEAELIIDAMLGIGISGEVREPYVSCITTVNALDIPILSVDVASGLGTDNSVHPNMTVTFHDVKEGMTKENSGEIVVLDIGIPKEAAKYLGPGELVYYPKPGKDSHKGDNGRLLIIGGGPYTGAPALAGLAAYRIGVDLVHIATPAKTYEIIASYSPNFIVHRLGRIVFSKENIDTVKSLVNKVDAVLVGPGLGDAPKTQEAVNAFIKECSKPLVIDADAFKPVSADIGILSGKKGVLTPHSDEFKKLTREPGEKDLEKRAQQVAAFAKKTGFTVLLKGTTDIVSEGEVIKFNISGNPAMTVGGTGDVLAGLAGGMLAKGVSPFAAARIAAFVNGAAGDLAFEELGYSLMASDIISNIPLVLKSFLR
jgi:NAD(P)H-hydrate epimerase